MTIEGDRHNDGLIALGCGLAVVLAVALTWPFAELPFNDDWSYCWTVRQLAATGHLTYNGWASASVIAQAYWGLIWVKAFGFSITILRLSTVPLAAASVSICYLLARRGGLGVRPSVFSALVVGWSPLFLPLAATFMTDAPGFFCIVLSLYAVIRAIESSTRASIIGWLAAGAIVGIVGGTGRQIVWLAPMVGLPCVGWVHRRNLPVLAAAALAWVLTIAAAFWSLAWFARQDYSLPEPPVLGNLIQGLREPAHLLLTIVSIGLTLVLVILPATTGLLRPARLGRTTVRVAGVLLGCFLLILIVRHRFAMFPWMVNTISQWGILGRSQMSGDRPLVLPGWVRLMISFGVLLSTSTILATGIVSLTGTNRILARAWKFLADVPAGRPELHRATVPVLALFAVVYTAFLLPRASRNMIYDRYVLELMPCLMIPLLRAFPLTGRSAVAGWGLLAVWGFYGVASTQEMNALARARVIATNRFEAAGHARTEINAGAEYNYWTELTCRGYINDARLKRPAGAYIGGRATPSVNPIYVLEYSRGPESEPTAMGQVDYFSLLPPFRRTIYIDHYTTPVPPRGR